jgi:hypothetical protein
MSCVPPDAYTRILLLLLELEAFYVTLSAAYLKNLRSTGDEHHYHRVPIQQQVLHSSTAYQT